MHLNRMFGILFHLLERGPTPARALADRYEVSMRTIYRDVENLSEAGVPIYATRGKGGGIALMEGYVLDRAMISPDEQSQILMSLRSLSATGTAAAQDAIDKIGHIFRDADADWIEVDFARWGSGEADRTKFGEIKDAILAGKAIAFDYVSSYGRAGRRTIYPLRLVYKSAAWYVQGFTTDGEKYRTFKLTRLTGLEITDEAFSRSDFSAPPIDSVEDSDPAPATMAELDLLFPPEMAFRLYDEFSPDQITRLPDGRYRVLTTMPADSWLFGYLISFGAQLEVAAPPFIRDGLADMARRIEKMYANKRI